MTHHIFGRLILAFLFLTCVIAVPVVTAQETSKENDLLVDTQDVVDEFDLYDYACTQKVEVDFEGGTVEEFVDRILKQAFDLNVMIRADVQKIELPKLMLRNISADTALNSLEQLSVEALKVEINDSQEYYVIGPDVNRAPEVFEVLNVSRFLMDRKTQTISVEETEKLMSAIHAGQELVGTGSGRTKISLHPETGLLFVRGSVEETMLVSKIVNELGSNERANSGMGGGAGMGMGGAGSLGGSGGDAMGVINGDGGEGTGDGRKKQL